MKIDFTLLIFEHFFQGLVAGAGGNVSDEGLGAWNSFDGIQIYSDNGRIEGHELFGDLHPSSWGGTQIDYGGGIVEEIIFSI